MSEQIVIPVTGDDGIMLRNARFALNAAEIAFNSALFTTANRLLPNVEPSAKRTMQLDPEGENIILMEQES